MKIKVEDLVRKVFYDKLIIHNVKKTYTDGFLITNEEIAKLFSKEVANFRVYKIGDKMILEILVEGEWKNLRKK